VVGLQELGSGTSELRGDVRQSQAQSELETALPQFVEEVVATRVRQHDPDLPGDSARQSLVLRGERPRFLEYDAESAEILAPAREGDADVGAHITRHAIGLRQPAVGRDIAHDDRKPRGKRLLEQRKPSPGGVPVQFPSRLLVVTGTGGHLEGAGLGIPRRGEAAVGPEDLRDYAHGLLERRFDRAELA
jgi:hypothetical protein